MNFFSTYFLGPFGDMLSDWSKVIETIIAGLGNGFLYALVAIGFVIIFKSSSVFNYAQGAMVFFSALNFAGMLKLGVPWYLAGAFSLLIMVILAAAVERVVLRPLVGQDGLSLFMATIGVAFFIEGFAEALWGGDPKLLKVGLPEGVIFTDDYAWAQERGLNIVIQHSDLLAIGVGLVTVFGLYVFFQYSRIGRALRAVADDHAASMSIGIPLNQMWVVVWALSGLTAFLGNQDPDRPHRDQSGPKSPAGADPGRPHLDPGCRNRRLHHRRFRADVRNLLGPAFVRRCDHRMVRFCARRAFPSVPPAGSVRGENH